MRIGDLQLQDIGEWTVISAQMCWEDNDRPVQRIEFQVGKSLSDDVECSPNAFLAATAIPAAYYGEKRLTIEGRICPVLHDGILTILTQFKEWFDKQRILPSIEPSQGFKAEVPSVPRRAAQLFSGGIDALATLRRNRLIYPTNHPGSIRDCLHVFGMHPVDYRGSAPCPKRLELWERNLPTMRAISNTANVEFHLLRTNVHGIFEEQDLQAREYHSATLLSLGHLLTRRASDLYLASTNYLADLEPWGSHPLIDPYLSSSLLQIYHDGTQLRRLEKVRLVANWPEVLPLLNVCTSWTVPDVGMNCGKCEKCLRTMIELLICGRLDQCPTFPTREIDPQLIYRIRLGTHSARAYFTDCIEPLRAMGRHDLVAAINDRIADFDGWRRRKAGYGWKSKIRKLDEKILRGWLRKQWHERQKRHQ